MVRVTVLIESPVVELPRGPGSRDTLVAHLGNVHVSNAYAAHAQPYSHKVGLGPHRGFLFSNTVYNVLDAVLWASLVSINISKIRNLCLCCSVFTRYNVIVFCPILDPFPP